MAWILGLTGGIGAGKSTAADWFRREGFPVVDADALSRSLTAPKGGAIEAIRSAFGSSFITPEGAMDRAKMRELVFEHPAERERLEAVLRPRIRSECLAALERACRAADAAGKAFAVFDCPLLCEWPEAAAAAERILVIDLAQDEQIRRVCLRSGLSPSASARSSAHSCRARSGSRKRTTSSTTAAPARPSRRRSAAWRQAFRQTEAARVAAAA